MERMKQVFKAWTQTTSFHGLNNIMSSRYKATKLMWLLFLICMLGFCSYMIVRSFMDYFNYEVTSKIRLVNDMQLQFPGVIVCNPNIFATKAAKEYLLAHFRNLTGDTNLNDLTDLVRLDPEKVGFMYEDLKSKVINDPKLLAEMSFNKNESLYYCNIGLHKCSPDFVSAYFDPNSGVCLKFNSGYDENQNQVPIQYLFDSGPLYGLEMQLFVGFVNQDFKNITYFSTNSGVKVVIFNQTQYPLTSQAITVETGHSTFIGLNKYTSRSLPAPFSTCKDSDSFQSKVKTEMESQNFSYTQKTCLEFCKQFYINEFCGCSYYIYPFVRGTRYCQLTNMVDLNCLNKAITNYSFDLLERYCFNSNCPIDCYSEWYDYVISYSDFPSPGAWFVESQSDYGQHWVNLFQREDQQMTFENYKKSMVFLNVYFDNIRYTQITETEATNIIYLISSIGGTLGLFLGASFLSFVELVDLAIELMWAWNVSNNPSRLIEVGPRT